MSFSCMAITAHRSYSKGLFASTPAPSSLFPSIHSSLKSDATLRLLKVFTMFILYWEKQNTSPSQPAYYNLQGCPWFSHHLFLLDSNSQWPPTAKHFLACTYTSPWAEVWTPFFCLSTPPIWQVRRLPWPPNLKRVSTVALHWSLLHLM